MNAINRMIADARECNRRLSANGHISGDDKLREMVERLQADVATLTARMNAMAAKLSRHTTPDQAKNRSATVQGVVMAVSDTHGVPVDAIFGTSRKRNIAWARFNVWHELHKLPFASLPWIAKRFGCHHSTVLHGVRQWQGSGEDYLRSIR